MDSGNALGIDINNEHRVLCEKIIRDINAVFSKDPDLSTFEIIPIELNCNKSPVIHLEHNLGLESWCAAHVYDHAHRTLIAHRRQTLPQQQRCLQQQQHSDSLVKYLNVALLINPDVTTFWHIRRQLVQKNRLSINRELQFAALVLSKKPKSNEAFAYRRWLYSFQSADAIDWPNEISICERTADRCPSNYHAWSHRQWVLQNAGTAFLQSELMRSEKFMRKHISDYSSYHYRQLVLARAYDVSYYEVRRDLTATMMLAVTTTTTPTPLVTLSIRELESLRELIKQHMVDNKISTTNEILQLLLPPGRGDDVDDDDTITQQLLSFLYCCNLAAHDMRLCDEQTSLYGTRDCFELHRRASLKFIVVQCVRLLTGNIRGKHLPPATAAAQEIEFQAQLCRFDYNTTPFLAALMQTEAQRSEKHENWCKLHLGFDGLMDKPDINVHTTNEAIINQTNSTTTCV